MHEALTHTNVNPVTKVTTLCQVTTSEIVGWFGPQAGKQTFSNREAGSPRLVRNAQLSRVRLVVAQVPASWGLSGHGQPGVGTGSRVVR